jgi:hypothetical protein
MGQWVGYSDFREVDGVLLPHEFGGKFANSFLGEFQMKWTEVEFGAEVAEGAFELRDAEAD